ncbi:hypothetical protein ACQ1ZK_19680, partial [Enterococcus faecium]
PGSPAAARTTTTSTTDPPAPRAECDELVAITLLIATSSSHWAGLASHPASLRNNTVGCSHALSMLGHSHALSGLATGAATLPWAP